MAYFYIFAGSYILFFFVTWLYILITRNNSLSVYRENGLSDEKIREKITLQDGKHRSLASRSTLINGSLFGFLLAMVYTLTVLAL